VISAAWVRFGAGAVKSRCTRSCGASTFGSRRISPHQLDHPPPKLRRTGRTRSRHCGLLPRTIVPKRSGVHHTGSTSVNELVEAAGEKLLAKTIARYGRVDLLCIDELGYMELGRRGAELLFQVLTEREEKNSVAIASNDSFGGWTKTFTDPRLCAAIVDRLTFGGNIIETGTDSYRLAQTRAQAERQATGR